MKRIFLFVAFVMSVVACDREDLVKTEADLSVSRTEIALDADATVEEVVIESDMPWHFENIPEWCGTVRPSYGDAGTYTVRIRGRFYEGKEDRSAVMSVVSGSTSEDITLVQYGWKTLEVTLDMPALPNEGGDITLTVASDFEYGFEIAQGSDWLTKKSEGTPLAGKIVLNAPRNDSDVRTALVVFTNQERNFRKEVQIMQHSAISANRYYDGEVIELQKSTKGKGVNAVILGDGFIDEDLVFDGAFETMAKRAMEAMFTCEPMISYREYFNIYAVAAESEERGTGRVTSKNTALRTFFRSSDPMNLTMDLDYERAYAYMIKTGVTDRINTALLVLVNTDETGGTNISYPDGRVLALCTNNAGSVSHGFEGVVRHELVGHNIGRLDEEYMYKSGPATQDYVQELAARHAKGWSLNIDTTNDPTQVAWKHFIGVPGYENVGCYSYEGGVVFSGGGVCQPESMAKPNCMMNNAPYFNAPSREQIVKHILEMAGEEYSFEAFIAQDKLRGPH